MYICVYIYIYIYVYVCICTCGAGCDMQAPIRIEMGKACEQSAQIWLDQYPATAKGCMELIHERSECNQHYFNYADAKSWSDRNCGCIKDTNSTCTAADTGLHNVVSIYKIPECQGERMLILMVIRVFCRMV